LVRGDVIQYIYTDAAHRDPLRRVMPLDLISEVHEYDKEKYRDMLLETAETVFGYFGFDRTAYGLDNSRKNRKLWHELREVRIRDIETERI
jgi:hypothetical protein